MSLLRLILIVLAALFLYRLLRAALARPSGGPRARPGGRVIDRGEMVRDPVCGMFLPREDALTLRVGSRVEHFCSPECRDRFLAAGREGGPG